jgi:glucokinase
LKKEFVITIDLGGTKALSALINKKKQIVDRIKMPTDSTKGPEYIVESIANSVKELLKKTNVSEKKIRAIAMGVPGAVNPESGIISVAPNLNIKEYNIKNALQKYFDIPVLLENDVNMAGLGIKNFEYDNKINNMLVVFVGTGIGAALFFNGTFFRGSSFYAGEIGHMKMNSDGTLSSKNSSSTFEKIASRTAIVNSIIERSKKEETSLKKIIKNGEKVKSKILSNAIKKKDKVVIEEMEKACIAIGTLLGSITTLLNLDTIVVGGGVVEANEEFMLSRIRKAFYKSVIEPAGKIVELNGTKLGDDAPLYGGLALADEFLSNS